MPLSALAMVILAAMLHAFWNIVAKKTDGNKHFVLMGGLVLAVLWAPLGLWLGWQQVPRWGRAGVGLHPGERADAPVVFQRAAQGLSRVRPDRGLPRRARHRPVDQFVRRHPGARRCAGSWHGALGVACVCASWCVRGRAPAARRCCAPRHAIPRSAARACRLRWRWSGDEAGDRRARIAAYTVLDGYAVQAPLDRARPRSTTSATSRALAGRRRPSCCAGALRPARFVVRRCARACRCARAARAVHARGWS